MKKDSAKFKAHLRRVGARGGKAGGKSKVRGGKGYYSKIAKARWERERALKASSGTADAGGAGPDSGRKTRTPRGANKAV